MNKNVCYVHLCLSLLVDITATEDYHMMRTEYNVSYIKDLISARDSLPHVLEEGGQPGKFM